MNSPLKFVAVIAFFFVTCFADAYLKAWDRHRGSLRFRDTYYRMTAIARALDKVSEPKGRFPCIRSHADYPLEAEMMLAAGSFVDGWGGEITIVASPSRYVITSLGSDHRRDDRYDARHVNDYATDAILSNEGPLHVHASLVTAIDLVPRPADALAEASDCHTPFRGRDFDASENSLYFKTEAQARAAETEAMRQNFSTEVRRAVGGDWLVVTRKTGMEWHQADFVLREIGERHGVLVP